MYYEHFTEEQRLSIYKLAIVKLQEEYFADVHRVYAGLCQVLRTSAGLPAQVNSTVLDNATLFPEVYDCKPMHTFDRNWWFSRNSIGNDARIRVLLLAIAQLEKLQP